MVSYETVIYKVGSYEDPLEYESLKEEKTSNKKEDKLPRKFKSGWFKWQ